MRRRNQRKTAILSAVVFLCGSFVLSALQSRMEQAKYKRSTTAVQEKAPAQETARR